MTSVGVADDTMTEVRPIPAGNAAGRAFGLAAFGAMGLATLGLALAFLAVLWAGTLGAWTYAPYGAEVALGIAFGAGSIAALSLALILAARPPGIEPLFGGLDRIYRVHKWLGIAAPVLMIAHNTVEPDIEDFVRETDLGDFASDIGELALSARFFPSAPVRRIGAQSC